MVMLGRRTLLALAALPPAARADDAIWAALRQGAILLLRHADAPGVGDPAGFRLHDCSTQRNLGEAGRKQARRIGEQLRARGVPVAAVWSSQWCRCLDTARLAALGPVRPQPAFNSFFADRGEEPAATRAALALLRTWEVAQGTLLVVTHQVNITALTGVVPASGAGVVLAPGSLAVLGEAAF